MKKTVIILLLLIMSIGLLSGCTEESSTENPTTVFNNNCKLFVNEKDLSNQCYVNYDKETHTFELPLLSILKALDATVKWEDEMLVNIEVRGDKYTLNVAACSLYSSEDSASEFLVPAPGGSMYGEYVEQYEEFMIDSVTVREFLSHLKLKLEIDHDSKTVYIDDFKQIEKDGITYEIVRKTAKVIKAVPTTKITIPETVEDYPVKMIGHGAFCNQDELTDVTLPQSIERIEGAFDGCDSLQQIDIPKNVNYIWLSAFNECTSLTVINVDEENEWYSDIDGVLYDKEKSVLHTYPSGKKNETFSIPDTVTELYSFSSFAECKYLRQIYVGKQVKEIPYLSFLGCSVLSEICVDENNEAYSDLNGVLYNKEKSVLITYPEGKTDELFVIPDTVTKIADDAFGVQAAALRKISIPAGVQSFPEDYLLERPEDVVLLVKEGSAAEQYAKTYDLEYKYWDTENHS